MLGHHQKKNSEFWPLIPTTSSGSPSSKNTKNNNNIDHENTVTNKLKRFLQPRDHLSPKAGAKANYNQRRKRSTIDLRSRDYKMDASGKKGFQVQIPMKFLMYIAIVFFLVPLMAGFIVLFRIFFIHNDRHHHSNRGVGNIQHVGATMEENGIVDVAENQQDSSLHSLRGRISGGDNLVTSSSLGDNDNSHGDGIDLTGLVTDPVGEGGDIFANSTAQHIYDPATNFVNATSPVLEQRQRVEEVNFGDVSSEANVYSPGVDEKLVDKNKYSISSNIENVITESSQINADDEKVISSGEASEKVQDST